MQRVMKRENAPTSASPQLLCVLLLLFLLSHFVAPSVTAKESLTGEWVGAYQISGRTTFVQVRFQGGNDGIQGSVTIQERLAFGLPITSGRLDRAHVRFDLVGESATLGFDGEWSDGTIVGTVA